MKFSLFKKPTLYILSFFLLALTFPAPQSAQTTTSISVTPSIIHLDLSKDQPQADLFYTNLSSQTIELSLSAQNFTELEDGYKLSFLEGKEANNYKYGLSSWIDFSQHTLVISPHSSEKVTVYVNKNELSPGAHYASILAQVSTKTPTTGSININTTLASLLFVRTNTGKEIEKASIISFNPILDGIFFSFPNVAFFRLQNTGDTDLTPFGLITITDINNHIVSKGVVNEDSASTLPESIRRYDTKLIQQVPFILPGIYKATLSLHAGKTSITIKKSVQFFSEGTLPLIQIALITFAILLFIFYRRRKRHIKMQEIE